MSRNRDGVLEGGTMPPPDQRARVFEIRNTLFDGRLKEISSSDTFNRIAITFRTSMPLHPETAISQQSPEDWIKAVYASRRRRNGSYSLRSFANQVEISVSHLSEIFTGKRRLSPQLISRIADSLAIPQEAHSKLLHLATHGGGSPKRARAKAGSIAYSLIDADQIEVIADWSHFAILNLMKLPTFVSDAKWIAHRLGLSTVEVRDSLNRLKRVGLIERGGKDQGYHRTKANLATTDGVPSQALRRAHRQDLAKAGDALENTPLSLRDISSITFPADKSRIPEARKIIRQFEKRMARFMETADAASVYNLNVQLIPITKEEL